MAEIVIYTGGTLGDHLPFVALGQALAARGHHVRMAINQAMHGYAHRAGLEAVALTDLERGEQEARENAWAWDHWHHPDPSAHPKARPFDAGQFVTQARELIDLCRNADLLISTAIRSLGYLAHAALDLPWLTVSMNPFVFWQPVLEEERLALEQARKQEYEVLTDLLAYTQSELGITRALPPFSHAWLFARHVILASSQAFSRPDLDQLQPHASLDLTGFWFYEDPAWRAWQPDDALRRFSERRPLVLSFSSQPLEDPRAALALHVEAAARLGMPLLVQRGWAGFSERDLPANAGEVLFTDYLPHDWLFARAACAIQHGGIGSIARALRQGCPLLIEPYGNDQLYNASRVVQLGAGAAMHPFEMTAEGLSRVLSGEVLSPGCRERAQALGAGIAAEDGLAAACRAIEVYLERVRSGEEDRPGRPAPLLTNPCAPPLEAPAPQAPGIIAPSRPAPGRQAIPPIVHQSWKDANVPPRFAEYQRTWQQHHPGWRYCLWTDADNREFLRRHYDWFLPIYDSYAEPIMRADAVRYFYLYHYGGVYADLDVECLRPLEPLLEGRPILLGLEPAAHLEEHRARGYPLDSIVSNACMASVPGHPFWEHVIRQLVAYHHAASPLDATGPFLLTRAVQSYPEALRIEPAEVLSPAASSAPWSTLPAEERGRLAQTAFTVHHWAGTWWHPPAATTARQVQVSLLLHGEPASAGVVALDLGLNRLQQAHNRLCISCLMVTRNRPALAQRAVRCFQRQSYPNKELVIVDDGEDNTLADWVAGLNDPQIVFVRLQPEGKTLGELRNLALEKAIGAYVAQWDDDDLSAPQRLEVQMAVIHLLQADACALERQLLWWPESRRLAVSTGRIWEGSFLCARARLPRYPHQPTGEDTPAVEQVVAGGRVAVLDDPALYTYVYHGSNSFSAAHWEEHWQAATERYEGDLYDVMIRDLQEHLQLDLTPWIVREPAAPPAATAGPAEDDLPPARATPSPPLASTPPWPSPGRVLILTPVKDAAPFLPRFWENLRALTYPHDRISLAMLESDSADDTYAQIEAALPALQAEFASAHLFKQDFGYRAPGPRWETSEQFRRRSILARSRNRLLAQALADEEWVLWVDVDVAWWPADIIERLLAAGKDIVVPHCVKESTGETFDLNTFKLDPDAPELDGSPYLLDGILLPPRGAGRLYLSDLRRHHCVEVDAVGGAMLLVRADLHREGLVFPPFAYRQHIETEGLALMAKDMGYTCWGLPNLEIRHP